MRLLADESVDHPIVVALQHDGHDIVSVAALSPSIADENVLAEANRRNALLLTADKDFGELVFRQGKAHAGVVLIRLAGLAPHTKSETVCRAFTEHGTKLLGCFSVISAAQVRIRRRV